MSVQDLVWCGYDRVDMMNRYVVHKDIRKIVEKLNAAPHSYIEFSSFKSLKCSAEQAERLLATKEAAPAIIYETPGGGFLLFHTVCDVCSYSFDLTEALLTKEELKQVESPKIRERGSVKDLKRVASRTKTSPDYLKYLVKLVKEREDDEARD